MVGLQHEQAQAAAKLQLSHEELLHGRSQLLAAKRWLLEAEADGPAVDALSLVSAHVLNRATTHASVYSSCRHRHRFILSAAG